MPMAPSLDRSSNPTVPPFPPLASLSALPYLDEQGQLPPNLQRCIGLYAIFDEQHILQYVGYSRDVALSLQQHLMRVPYQCQWVKVSPVSRPSRTILEAGLQGWLAEVGTVPPGNGDDRARWCDPIDAKTRMTAEEQSAYATAPTEGDQLRCLKQVARRVEADLQQQLAERGLQQPLRFDPKLKAQGLLNLKP